MFLLVSKFEMRMLLNVVYGKNPSTKGENTKRTKGPVIIYCLGGGGEGILGGITWFLGEQKGGFSHNWEPKRGDPWKLWRDSDKNSNAENNAQNPLTAKA